MITGQEVYLAFVNAYGTSEGVTKGNLKRGKNPFGPESDYKIAKHPKTGKWWVVGKLRNAGRYGWMQMFGPYDTPDEAQKRAEAQPRIDKAARAEVADAALPAREQARRELK